MKRHITFILLLISLSAYSQEEFIAKVMPPLLYTTPLFSLYLNNIGLVNTSLIILAIVLNFVDLELSRFRFRKNPDQEVANELS